jgi:hypothetical protein
MNGVEDMNDLTEISIIGVNKLKKEIHELKHVPNKMIDEMGLHRNEDTFEMEGELEQKDTDEEGMETQPGDNSKISYNYSMLSRSMAGKSKYK